MDGSFIFVRTGGANVYPSKANRKCFLGPADSTPQTAHQFSRFCAHGRGQRVPILYNGPPLFSLKITHLHGGSGPPRPPIKYMVLWVRPKSRIHDRDRQTHRQTDNERWESCLKWNVSLIGTRRFSGFRSTIQATALRSMRVLVSTIEVVNTSEYRRQ